MDPIADLLTIVRNGYKAHLEQTTLPHSHIKESVVKILVDKGFLSSYTVEGDKVKPQLRIVFHYTPKGHPVISGIKRISKPGVRLYSKASQLSKLSGVGINIVSTSAGVLADDEARKQHLGGEVICQVW